MDASTAYFLKKYYPNVIKWWLVAYNPESVRIWPSLKEKEEALRLEQEQEELLRLEQEQEQLPALEQNDDSPYDMDDIPDDAYNATTGSYSGLYGKKPVDEETQKALDLIMGQTNSQNNVDFIFSDKNISDATLSQKEKSIIDEANAIYERLLNEAADEEAKKRAELEQLIEYTEKNGIME